MSAISRSRTLRFDQGTTGAIAGLAGLVLFLLTLGLAQPAHAARLLTANVSAPAAVDRSCKERQLSSGGGYVQRTVTSSGPASVMARLDGPASSDWDLAVFDADTGRLVGGSAYRGSSEVASGFVTHATTLKVQACRLTGGASQVPLSVDSQLLDTSQAQPSSLVNVLTPTRAQAQKVADLGLDPSEDEGPGYVGVVLHGPQDVAKLVQNGLAYSVVAPDLAAEARQDREADAAFAASVNGSSLPSGQETYRRLDDYSEEMKRLAHEHPDLVKPITLPYPSWEGRPVEGIEITTDPNVRDGKPVFLNMALHHSREWPAGEHVMEWAYELILGYRRGDAYVRDLVQKTRTILVPVINPDGFNASREAGELLLAGGGRPGTDDENLRTVQIVSHVNEYRRKNCRLITDAPSGNCAQPSAGLAEGGVDPNRNYGGFWGGPGASADPTTQTYYGPGPFSEPDTQNVRDVMSRRQVVTMITNHTFSGLVLRPPGIAVQGSTPDEAMYKQLGATMAAENGYTNQWGYELYDTTGTTEDWSYWATGGFGFTFEIGPNEFHPPYAETIAEYEGTTAAADRYRNGGGNRRAYFKMTEATKDMNRHSAIGGQAPPGAVLRLNKVFETPTSKRNPDGSTQTFVDGLSTALRVPASGWFLWHVNPSTRPLIVKSGGRAPKGSPSPQQQFNARLTAVPCAEYDNPPATCYEDHLITVPSGAGIDNAKMTVRIEWLTPGSDYDMKIYRADAAGNATGNPLSSSGNSTTNFEETALPDPVGRYVVRVINWAAAEPWTGTAKFAGPDKFAAATTESWTLRCEQPEGTVISARPVVVKRGERLTVDLRNDCTRNR